MAGSLLGGLLLVLIMLMALERSLIFVPTPLGVGPSPGGEVWLRSADGVAIHAWYLTHPAATHSLLHLHGNAGNLESRRAILGALRDLPLNVLAIDYRGYGKSAGEPSESGINADAFAAYSFLLQHTPAVRVVVYGESLGGGPAVELAARQPVGALVLQSSFTSIPDMAALMFPWLPVRYVVRTQFDNLRKVANIAAPKLIIHSRADEVVPFHMGERLHRVARAPKQHLWLDHSRHNDLFDLDGDTVLATLRAFLQHLPR